MRVVTCGAVLDVSVPPFSVHYVDGERWAVSQEIHRLEDIIATKSAILNGLYRALND